MILLISQGEVGQAQERARFWAARLKKLGYGDEKLVDLMEEIALDPSAFAEAVRHGGFENAEEADAQSLAQLIRLAEGLPPACHYRLQPGRRCRTAGGRRETRRHRGRMAATCSRREMMPMAATPIPADTAWLDWLAAHPLAWHSFAVLEDLLMSIDYVPFDDEELDDQLDALEDALLDRALALLRLDLRENGADACKLEWGWLQNRPALRLLGRLIEVEGGTAEELPLLEWLVLTLNPNDNQGLRERLVHIYAGGGRAAEALAVCERYPNDMLGAMVYGRVLALHQSGRHDEAAAALTQAQERSPRSRKCSRRKNRACPSCDPA